MADGLSSEATATGNNLYRKRSSGTEAEQPVLDTGNNMITSDWATDGMLTVYTTTTSGFTGVDI